MSDEAFNPYLAPRTPSGPDPDPSAAGPGAGYRPLKARGFWTVSLLSLGLVLGLAGSAALLSQAALLRRAAEGQAITEEEAQFNDARINGVEGLQALTALATGLAFVMWSYRARHNLPALGATNLKYSPAWMVWGWFVSIFSFFRPIQAIGEVWRESRPHPDPDSPDFPLPPGARYPGLLVAWWTCMIFWFIVPNLRNLARVTAQSNAELRNMTWLILGLDLIGCAACILGIALVRGLTARQGDQHRRLSGADPFSDPVDDPWA
ncbi:MAG: DUF4328 domain-containing protein [Isosphaeraceae bacterium]